MSNRSDELSAYFAGLGLTYSGDRRRWEKGGTDEVRGPYRRCRLHVLAERKGELGNVGADSQMNASYRMVYLGYLRVSITISPPVQPSVAVIPRNEYALVNKRGQPVVDGKRVAFTSDARTVGQDLLHAEYIAVDRLLDTGVPEFDARFGVICTDERYAGTIVRPDLARWFAADPRSAGMRVCLKDDAAHVFFQTGRGPAQTTELFTPEWIFPAADYLIDLLEHAQVRIARDGGSS